MELSGKACLVTGANSGLGMVMAKKAAAMGADVFLVCRNNEKAQDAAAEVQKSKVYPSPAIMTWKMDLLMESIKKMFH